MTEQLVLAIDQGTTGSTVLVMDRAGRSKGRSTVAVPQYYPGPGQVEHDGEEIWQGVKRATSEALSNAGVSGRAISAVGITNQRETTLLWDRKTSEPIHRAIVWQDRRTAPECAALRARGLEERVYEQTGLVLDPYFSGTKIAWLLAHVEGARERALRSEIAFGTIDSWLVFRLSQGAHVTDVTNASRTTLMSLKKLAWDDELLGVMGVPREVLPEIVASAGVCARTRGFGVIPDGVPISGIAGDQQAALFGQGCFRKGDVKCTYGTGAFVLMNVGSEPVASGHRLLSTVAWQIPGEVAYALEGSAFIAGAAVQWLRDGLGVIKSAGDIEALAASVPDAGEVIFVPALTGMGAPHWSPEARGLLCGIGRGTTLAHVARATLDGIALQIAELVEAMALDARSPIASMRVDGGASANDLLMQIQADLARTVVVRPRMLESTALGAGMLAALGAGLVSSRDEILGNITVDRSFDPCEDSSKVNTLRARWRMAVARALLTPSESEGRQ